MSEKAVPVLDRTKPHIEVRDRARPNVKYQQKDNLFDRKGLFFTKADFAINPPEPPPPKVTVREISERHVGTTKKSVVKTITDLIQGGKVVATTRPRGRPPGSTNKPKGVDAVLQAAGKENAAAAHAETRAS